MKLYPPFVVLGFVIMMVGFSYPHYSEIHLTSFTTFIGTIIIVLAITIFVKATRLIKLHETTIYPDEKPTFLIEDGIFKYSRNPIYLAMVIFLTGVTIICRNYYTAILPFLFAFWVQNKWIFIEERNLKKAFSKKYLKYAQYTRRWI